MPVKMNSSDPVSVNGYGVLYRVRGLLNTIIFMVICLGSANALAGKIYKWTDAEGNVHYGSEKPAGTEAEKMKVDTAKTGVDRGAEALDKLKQEVDDEAQRIKEEGVPEQPPVASLPAREVKRRCQAARQDLATIQARGQLRERDEQGNTRYVSDKEKQQRIKAAQKQIREYCY